MEKFFVEGTQLTPKVDFDPTSGSLELSGKSIPDNPLEFYQPIMNWLDEYEEDPPDNTEVKVFLYYFNSASSKYLLDIFKRLEHIHDGGRSDVVVKWHYEEGDENSMEDGKDFQELLEMPFELLQTD